MLAVRALGADVDVAPIWLIGEASKPAKFECERTQRVRGRGGGLVAEAMVLVAVVAVLDAAALVPLVKQVVVATDAAPVAKASGSPSRMREGAAEAQGHPL